MRSETSVERAFAILEMFGRERRMLSLKDLSEFCHIPASTCHSLLHTLLRRSYLYQAGRRKDFYPTRKLYDLGTVLIANDPILQRFLPVMENLRETTRETVILGKRQSGQVVYLEVLEGPQTIRYSARAGDLKPLHSTCIGKVLLAACTPEEIRELLNRHPAQKVTAKTITNYAGLMEDLEAGKRRGFFTTSGENVPDVTALGVPVSANNEVFGLAVAGPSHRIETNFNDIAQALLHARSRLPGDAVAGSVGA